MANWGDSRYVDTESFCHIHVSVYMCSSVTLFHDGCMLSLFYCTILLLNYEQIISGAKNSGAEANKISKIGLISCTEEHQFTPEI